MDQESCHFMVPQHIKAKVRYTCTGFYSKLVMVFTVLLKFVEFVQYHMYVRILRSCGDAYF